MKSWYRIRARRALGALCAAVLALSVAACGSDGGDDDSSSGSGGSSGSGELATLKLQNCVSVLQVAIAPLLVGQELGFFEDEGIGKIEVSNSSGSTAQCVQLTAAGQANFTSPVPDLLFNSAAGGVDPGVRCVYDLIRRPTMAFMVDPDSGYTSFADMEGKKVGVHDLASAYIPLFEASMEAEGGDPSTVEYQVTGYGAQVIDALKTDKVDGALYWDYEAAGYPGLGYDVDVLSPPENVQSLFSSCLAFNKDFIEDQPELVEGYVRGLTKSMIFADENPEATVQLFWKLAPEAKPTNLSDDEAVAQALTVLEGRLQNNLPADTDPDPRWGAWGEEQWQAYADFLGVGDDVDITTLYTTDFIDAANDVDEDEVRQFAADYEVES